MKRSVTVKRILIFEVAPLGRKSQCTDFYLWWTKHVFLKGWTTLHYCGDIGAAGRQYSRLPPLNILTFCSQDKLNINETIMYSYILMMFYRSRCDPAVLLLHNIVLLQEYVIRFKITYYSWRLVPAFRL